MSEPIVSGPQGQPTAPTRCTGHIAARRTPLHITLLPLALLGPDLAWLAVFMFAPVALLFVISLKGYAAGSHHRRLATVELHTVYIRPVLPSGPHQYPVDRSGGNCCLPRSLDFRLPWHCRARRAGSGASSISAS